jgi:hypothetical protein
MRSTTPRRTDNRRQPAVRYRLLALLVGGALAQMAATPALADSGVGSDTEVGNTLMPGGGLRLRARDPDGLGEGVHNRTPTGFLNTDPPMTEPVEPGTGWRWRGNVEAGGLAVDGNRDAARYNEYKSLENGFVLSGFTLLGESGDGQNYVSASAASLGRDDGFVTLTTGRYNGWRLRLFYNETPHVSTSTYRNLWNGVGTGHLTLANLSPGGAGSAAATDDAISAAALAIPYSTLSVQRQKGGLRLDLPFSETLKAFAALSTEQRRGARPFGLTSGGGGGTGGVEIPETVNYDTHEIVAGLQWATARTSANVQVSASLFRNNTSTQTVENPLFLTAPVNFTGVTTFPRAVFDLVPDNDYYNLKAEFAHTIPEWAKTRFTGVVSLARSRQNDTLIPSTPYSGITVNNIGGGSWETLDSLSRSSAERQIDSRLFDFTAAAQPLSALDVKARWRRYETIDKSPQYWACNPLNGQWGRMVNDGSGNSGFLAAATDAAYSPLLCDIEAIKALGVVPSSGSINIGAVQYDVKQDNLSLSGDWRMARGQSATLSVERESIHRTNRERDKTWEDRAKLSYVNRNVGSGTLRLSAEYASRRGSTYAADPYDEFFSASLGPSPTAAGTNLTGWIHVNDLHRKFDLADRDTQAVNARINQALSEDMDVSLSLQSKAQRYPGSAYGRNGTQRLNSINAEWAWAPTPVTAVSATLGGQKGRMAQVGLHQNGCLLGATYYFYSDGSVNNSGAITPAQAAAGITVVGNSTPTAENFLSLCGSASALSPLYPTSRTWTMTQDDETLSATLGVRHDFGRWRAELNYGYTDARTSTAYTYNAAALGLVTSGVAPTAAQQAALDLIGSGMGDLRYRLQTLDLNVVVPVTPKVWTRWMVRYENTKIVDWHYDGVAENPTPAANQQTYLDSGPQSYRNVTVGVMLGVNF